MYSGTQCENKFKELRKKYVKVKDHNKQSGNSPMTCKFFNEFEEVLGDKPCVQPVVLASNLRKRSTISQNSDTEDRSSKDDSSKDEENDRKKKIKKTRVQRELSEWSIGLREDAKRREEAKEQRHKELVSASDRAVAAYKEMMEKLIDKL